MVERAETPLLVVEGLQTELIGPCSFSVAASKSPPRKADAPSLREAWASTTASSELEVDTAGCGSLGGFEATFRRVGSTSIWSNASSRPSGEAGSPGRRATLKLLMSAAPREPQLATIWAEGSR